MAPFQQVGSGVSVLLQQTANGGARSRLFAQETRERGEEKVKGALATGESCRFSRWKLPHQNVEEVPRQAGIKGAMRAAWENGIFIPA